MGQMTHINYHLAVTYISCVGMNTGGLNLHKLIVTTYSEIVYSYKEFNNSHAFNSTKLDCTIPTNEDNKLKTD